MSDDDTRDFRETGDFEESRRLLGDTLHLDGPASAAVTRRALDDSRFAFYLLMTKDSPSLLAKLISSPPPPAVPLRAEAAPADEPASAEPGNAALAASAGKAFVKWGMSGFARIDKERLERRLAACQACEFLADPPRRLLYQGVKLLMNGDAKVCSACGCVASKKAALPTEACPRLDPANPNLTRWGEPAVAR